MAKITRKHQKVFAGNASNNGQFGSAQDGTKQLSQDLAVLQSLAAFENGWNDATISSLRLPTLEEMQALHYITTSQIAYILQEGIPEYHASTEYHTNSIVKKSGTYELYGSKVNTNTGNALPVAVDDANWQYLGDLAQLVNVGGADEVLWLQDVLASGAARGVDATGWQTRILNTVVQNDISGASLSSNQFTLPAGDYEAEFFAICGPYDYRQLRLRDITNSVTLGSGGTSNQFQGGNDNDTNGSSNLSLNCKFTLSGTTTLELQHYASGTNSYGSPHTASGEANTLANGKVTKK